VTLLGMIMGSLLGWSASLVLAQSTRIPLIVSWQSFAVAVSSSLLIGIFFGVQPARKAARLHPVDALR
jgi:putative ABC transport system permease protein